MRQDHNVSLTGTWKDDSGEDRDNQAKPQFPRWGNNLAFSGSDGFHPERQGCGELKNCGNARHA